MPPKLPGFYYDEERKKYFKIVKTGQATSASSDYSISAVENTKRLKKREHRSRRDEKRHIRKRTPVPRMDRVVLPRHSVHVTDRDTVQTQVQRYLHCREMGSLLPGVQNRLESRALGSLIRLTATEQVGQVSGRDNVTCLALDDANGDVFAGRTGGIVNAIRRGSSLIRESYIRQMPDAAASNVVGVNYNPDNRFLWSVSTEGESGSTIRGGISDDDYSDSVFYNMRQMTRLQLWGGKTAFSCAQSARGTMLLGLNGQIMALEGDPGMQSHAEVDLPSDALAVCFQGERTVLAGCRDGRIRQVDLRAQSVSTWYRSPTTVTNVAATDNLVVCSGLKGVVTVFDQRNVTQSLWTAPYKNYSTLRHGFAVDPSGRLVMVANDDRTVQLFNLAGGEENWGGKTASLVSGVSGETFSSNVSSIRWSEWGVVAAGGTDLYFMSVLA